MRYDDKTDEGRADPEWNRKVGTMKSL
jgi:hypothetical protein